jgi:hypothetical protein
MKFEYKFTSQSRQVYYKNEEEKQAILRFNVKGCRNGDGSFSCFGLHVLTDRSLFGGSKCFSFAPCSHNCFFQNYNGNEVNFMDISVLSLDVEINVGFSIFIKPKDGEAILYFLRNKGCYEEGKKSCFSKHQLHSGKDGWFITQPCSPSCNFNQERETTLTNIQEEETKIIEEPEKKDEGKVQIPPSLFSISSTKFIEFYPDSGKKRIEADMEYGKKEGNMITYYSDGKIHEFSQWRNDKKHGLYRSYFPDGSLERARFYQDGEIVVGREF